MMKPSKINWIFEYAKGETIRFWRRGCKLIPQS